LSFRGLFLSSVFFGTGFRGIYGFLDYMDYVLIPPYQFLFLTSTASLIIQAELLEEIRNRDGLQIFKGDRRRE
jgi:hypothetical protein